MKRLLWGMLILACGYVAALLLLGSSGGRGFFSPDTLEYRSQSEILCRGTELPLFRGPSKYHEHELVKFLVDKGYWQAREVNSAQWIFLFQWNHMWRDGESSFHRQFFWKKAHWIEWTDKNPEEASRFWPRILEMLRGDNEEKAVEMLYEKQYGAAFR
ncbi:MAG: hypothetical protein FJ271_28325 [Planctomycetes bacterium]|nr:hypothetical protein [Planctomycetota bacterium]